MTKRTRLFLFAAAGVVLAVLATALVAWAAGLGVVGVNGPDELAYVPASARMVAFANVRQVMNSPFHDRLQQFQATSPAGPAGFEARTGIKFDRDVDQVMIAAVADQAAVPADRSLVIARGRFDSVRIEGLMRERGANVEEYRGKRLVVVKDEPRDAALTFAEPGLVLFGPAEGVRAAIDAKAGVAQGIAANTEFMALVNDVAEGTAWSVAKFDSVSSRAPLPGAVISQLPPINWLAASGRIDSGLRGLVRAEARDEQSAQNLRDVVQGFLSLARMQGARDPAYRGMLDSVALSAQGTSVSLSFELTPAVLDVLSSQGSAVRRR